MNELDRAIGVAERDPARFSVDSAEIERRRKWTVSTRNQVSSPSFFALKTICLRASNKDHLIQLRFKAEIINILIH